MGVHNLRQGQLARLPPPTIQQSTIPAPTAGVDARQNLAEPAPKVCIYSFNMEPSEYGMRVRNGFREYQNTIDGGLSTGVKTIIPYTGDEYPNRLFVANNEGIWNVSVDGGIPALMIAFASAFEPAGYGIYTAYTTDAGANLLFYADRENGLFTYDPALDTWAQTAGITGIDITEVTFICVHKQRIWLCVDGDTAGYYLDPGAIAGAVTPFYFGSKFKHGGELVGLFNWSVDGGEGLDDYLVAVSRAGDVLPYQGDDPSLDTWQNVGTYFIGAIPKGNKIGSDFGGDLLLLSEFGLTAMSDLLNASSARSLAANSISFRIAVLLRNDLQDLKDYEGWELRYIPTEGLLIINMPKRLDNTDIQYVLTRTTEGWSFWRSVPMLCVDTWLGKTYFGTVTDTVEVMDVNQDNVDNDYLGGDPINFSVLTSYSMLGAPALFKRCEIVRPTFIGAEIPTFRSKVLYDYVANEIAPPSSLTSALSSVWDVALWDSAAWSAGYLNSTWEARGAIGIGRAAAVALNGYATTSLTLVSIDIAWRTGGLL